MHKFELNGFEELCKILDKKIDVDDIEIVADFGKNYSYVRESVIRYTKMQRGKILELKAEASDGDYLKYYTTMVAQAALFLTIFQILIPVISEMISKITKSNAVVTTITYYKFIGTLLVVLFVSYWLIRLRKFRFVSKWRNYIIVIIDEILEELEGDQKMNTITTDNRHEKALVYAVNAIKNSTMAPYVKALYLYGSYARNTHTYSSDIDLFLVLDIEAKKLHSEIMDLKSDVTDADDFCGVEVDLKVAFGDAWMRSNQLYHKNLKKDGIELWKKKN